MEQGKESRLMGAMEAWGGPKWRGPTSGVSYRAAAGCVTEGEREEEGHDGVGLVIFGGGVVRKVMWDRN